MQFDRKNFLSRSPLERLAIYYIAKYMKIGIAEKPKICDDGLIKVVTAVDVLYID